MSTERSIEDLYSLSPLQQGMLFHRVYSETSRTYFVQGRLLLRGSIERAAFERAWRELVVRHAALRTLFVWQGMKQPVQVVRRAGSVELPIDYQDWRALSAADREQRLESFLLADYARGFDLGRAPLMRVSLLQASDSELWCIWSHEHLISDGWSLSLLLGELMEIYRAQISGAPARLEPPVPYRGYVAWLQSRDRTVAERHFRSLLAGFREPTPLPGPGAPLRAGTSGCAECELRIPADATERLERRARERGFTSGSLVLGAWALLLGRFSGRREVLFGFTAAGRPAELEGAERAVGLFINTLPLRVNLAAPREPGAWLRALQAGAAEAQQFAYVSLAQIREWSELADTAEHRALFESLVVFENYPLDRVLDNAETPFRAELLELDATRASRRLSAERNNLPLTLVVAPGRELRLILAYSEAHFTAADASSVLAHYAELLQALAAALDGGDETLASWIALRGPARAQQLEAWQPRPGDAASTEAGASFCDRFEAHVRERGTATALVAGGERLSYRELDRRANRLAHWLRRRLPARQARVALCLERGADFVVALLGALKAGAAYVPLDPEWPVARLRWLVDDACADRVLTDQRHVDAFAGLPATDLVAIGRELEAESPDRPQRSAPRSAAAYVIYTSGSSGAPKGVVISHGALLDYLASLEGLLAPAPGEHFALLSSVATDLGHTSSFGSLAFGGCLHVLDAETALNGAAFIRYQRPQPLDVLKLTPTQLRLLLDAPEPAACLPRRTLVLGGERLPRSLLAELSELRRRSGNGCRIVNHYGPTETTVGVVAGVLPDASDASALVSGESCPIGRPLAHVRAYVLGEHDELLPAGASGELCIGGSSLADGYLGAARLSAEKFVPDPFSPVPGARLYRTGDLARYLDDGRIECLGRRDGQVKINGHRVEPEEIAAALRQHADVRAAAVQVVLGEGGPRVCAYTVGRERALEPEALRRWLTQRLPSHLVPSQFVALAALPLTKSGKLDVQALPRAAAARTSDASNEPWLNDTERGLSEIWQQVLGRSAVSRHDNFFELGGDSIKSLLVVSRARPRGLMLTPKLVFDHPTIARLAAAAGSAAEPAAASESPAPAAAQRDPSVAASDAPLSPIQSWFFESGHAHPQHWNQSVLLELPERFDGARLRAALDTVVQRHPALRTRFVQRADGTWRQRLASAGEAPHYAFERIDLSGVEAGERVRRIEQRLEQLQAELDLGRGPVFAALWFDDEGRPGRLGFTAHHLVIDVFSWGVLLGELQSLLAGELLLEPTSSPGLWAEQLARLSREPALLAELPEWLACTSEALPRDRDDAAPADSNRLSSAQSLERAFSRELSQLLLEAAPARWHVSVDSLLLAAIVAATCEWTRQSALTIECEGHGRMPLESAEALDLSRSVGWFTARFPLRFERPVGPNYRDWALAIEERRRAVPAGGTSYGVLRYLHQGPETEALRRQRRPELSFNNLGRIDAVLPAAGLLSRAPERVLAMRHPASWRSQAIEVTACVDGERLLLSWSFSRDLHDLATIERLAERCRVHLEGMASELALASGAEGWGLSNDELDELQRCGAEQVYGASPLQEGLWFHGLLGGSAYVNQLSLELSGLSLERFRQAWEQLALRHDVLRMRLCSQVSDGKGSSRGLERPLVVVQREPLVSFERLDYRGVSEEEQRRPWEAELERDERRGYVLDRAPLWRVVVADLGQGRSRVLWSRHHVLMDGWSTGQLLAELLASYGGAPSAENRPPYRHYSEWLRAQDRGVARDYWRAELRGAEVTPVPFESFGDSGARAEVVAAGGRARRELSSAESDALRSWVASRGLTLSTLCQAAWALLLARHAGTREVVFGVTVSGRPAELPGVERMLGLFINTVPLRVQVSGEARVVEWLSQLQGKAVEQRQYAISALHEIQADQRRGGRGLFDTLLVFENYPIEAGLGADVHGLKIERVEGRDDTHYAWTLVVQPGERLRLELGYAEGSRRREQAEQLLEQYSTVLEGLTRCERVAQVGLVSAENDQGGERRLETLARLPREFTLLQAFERQVMLAAEREALVDESERLSYRELWQRAQRLADELCRRGVRVEAAVGLCLGRSARQVVAMLGVLAAGGCYVPLDPSLPRARCELMLNDAGCRVLLTERAAWEPAVTAGIEVLYWEELEAGRLEGEAWPAGSASRERRGLPCADNLAYVIYTSGSTGAPKGVGISHRQVLRLFESSERHFAFSAQDVWTLFHSYAFDFSVWEMWGALLYGGRLVQVPQAATRDPSAFLALLQRESVSVLNQTPAAFHALAEAALVDLDSGAEREAGRSTQTSSLARSLWALRYVIFGGEALDETRLDGWRSAFGEAGPELVNMYGITETTVHVTHCALGKSAPSGARSALGSRIGDALADLVVNVLDRDGNPVPAGVPGEMLVGGAGVGRGYLGRPALTAQRFVPDPFAGVPGARAYRSGDLARRDARGGLEYLGRRDAQIKLRGHRIELGEVAHGLRASPELVAAEVLLEPRGDGDAELVACVFPRPGLASSADAEQQLARALRERLARQLPPYMLPSRYVMLERLPLTVNGKLDRQLLRELARVPAERQASTGEAAAGTSSETQRRLAQIWAELLTLPHVALDDDFFELGGHSLILTRVANQIRSRFGVQIPLEQLYAANTVRQMSEVVERLRGLAAASSVAPSTTAAEASGGGSSC